MALGYTNPKTGKFEKASSVQLRNTMRTDASEDVRKACWEVKLPSQKGFYNIMQLQLNGSSSAPARKHSGCCMLSLQ